MKRPSVDPNERARWRQYANAEIDKCIDNCLPLPEDVAYIYVLSLIDPEDNENFDSYEMGSELSRRFRVHEPEVRLRMATSDTGTRPHEELLRLCFKQGDYPLTPEEMYRRLRFPEVLKQRGSPVQNRRNLSFDDHADEIVDHDSIDEFASKINTRKMWDREEMKKTARNRIQWGVSLPDHNNLEKALASGLKTTIPVFSSLLRSSGLTDRQVGNLLVAMGAIDDEGESTNRRKACRISEAGKSILNGGKGTNFRAVNYLRHAVLEIVLLTTPILDLLWSDYAQAAGILASMASDLRRFSVRMGLADLDPTVVNAFVTVPREKWPSLLRFLDDDENQILRDYAAHRISLLAAERRLAERGFDNSRPELRPMWRVFIASAEARQIVIGHGSEKRTTESVKAHLSGIDRDVENLRDDLLNIGSGVADISKAYLFCYLIDCELHRENPNLQLCEENLEKAQKLGAQYYGLKKDLTMRTLTVRAHELAGESEYVFKKHCNLALHEFVQSCQSPDLAIENVQQYLSFKPNLARRLLELLDH